MFNCITGFYKPTEGRLTLTHSGGSEFLLERMDDFRISREAKVARTFQNIRLFQGMTVLENLMVAQHNTLMKASAFTVGGLFNSLGYRTANEQAIEKSKRWLEKIKLIDRADDPAGELPYGDQRRLEIARAMCTNPVLLCLDEPAAGLNPRESEELNRLLLDIRKEENIAILLIEHDMSVVMGISDHIVVLDYGVKISDGTAAHVKNDPAVIRAYLGVDDEEEALPEVKALVEEGLSKAQKIKALAAAEAAKPDASKPAAKAPATKQPAKKAAKQPVKKPGKKPARAKGRRT